jgi:hypothetical protein
MAIHNDNVYGDKRDLHIGGTGSNGGDHGGVRGAAYDTDSVNDDESLGGSIAAAAEALIESAGTWVTKAKAAARSADDFVHASPWQAIGAVALVGIAAGYLASRRSAPDAAPDSASGRS